MVFGFFESKPFDPEKDIPSLDGKTILVTGGNSGLGKAQMVFLAKHKPSKLYLAARSKAKADAAISDIEKAAPGSKIHFLELDLGSLKSVKTAADTFLAENSRLDILVNNAGIMAHPPALTPEGYEIQFGTNHMGHYLFTRQLLPLLSKTAEEPGADVRIINLSSEGHKFAPKGGWTPEMATSKMEEFVTWRRYGQSKLANILFTNELARRYPKITSVSIHPGGVDTNLSKTFQEGATWAKFVVGAFGSVILTNVENGALTQTWACVAPLEKDAPKGKQGVKNGEYYAPVAKVGSRSSYAKDGELAKKLWEWSEKEVVAKGY